MVARFANPKDHFLLLNSLKDIPENNWELTLIGDGPLYEKTVNYALECNLEEHITFTGECQNVEDYLMVVDIFLLITKSEGLPISIIEAMRAGLPTIASNVGGVKELIDDYTGLLVAPGNLDDLRTAIQSLLSNEKTRKDMGAKARRKFENEFTFSKMFQETEKYYNEVLFTYQNREQEVYEK